MSDNRPKEMTPVRVHDYDTKIRKNRVYTGKIMQDGREYVSHLGVLMTVKNDFRNSRFIDYVLPYDSYQMRVKAVYVNQYGNWYIKSGERTYLNKDDVLGIKEYMSNHWEVHDEE